jgi:hypothetical protein
MGDTAIDIARAATIRRERSITFASLASSASCCRIARFSELQGNAAENASGAVRNQQVIGSSPIAGSSFPNNSAQIDRTAVRPSVASNARLTTTKRGALCVSSQKRHQLRQPAADRYNPLSPREGPVEDRRCHAEQPTHRQYAEPISVDLDELVRRPNSTPRSASWTLASPSAANATCPLNPGNSNTSEQLTTARAS